MRFNLFVMSQKGGEGRDGRRERRMFGDGVRLLADIDRIRRRLTVENKVEDNG